MSTKPEQMYQCKLQMVRIPAFHTTGWIPARAATVGAKVELLPSKEFWEVIEVYENGMFSDSLRRHQLANRRSLPSIEAIQ